MKVRILRRRSLMRWWSIHHHSYASRSSSSSSSCEHLVKIATLSELVSTKRASAFELPEKMQEDFMDEGFVFHRDGEVYAFRNRCAHVTLPLDLDDEDFFSDDEDGDYIVCKSHGAKYLPKTGICVDGPCKGKSLRKLNVQVLDNYVYLNTQETPLSEKKNTSSSKERKVVKIVLTGGPCGGKSTALSKVTSALTNSGVRVLTVPEAATILFSNGFKPSDPLQMQTAITQTQILLEDQFERIASEFDDQTVMLCDRGLMDGKAYVNSETWKELLSLENLKETDARDTRYDSVIHLVTAADGAEDFYTLENNTARHESVEQAIELDRRTQNAWIGHSRLAVIENDDGKGGKIGFNRKIGNVIDSVKALLGLQPLAPEREKRYVVEVTENGVPEEYDFTTQDIYKVYLKGKRNVSKKYVQAKRYDEVTMYSQVVGKTQNDRMFERRSILDFISYKTWATSSTDVVGMLNSKRTSFMLDKHYVQIEEFDDGLSILRIQPPHGASVSSGLSRKLKAFINFTREIPRDEKFTMQDAGAKNFEKAGRIVPRKYFTFEK